MRRDVFQAIADPTRRNIIGLIATEALTPNAVAEKFNISRQAVSKHIQILTECGLLKLHVNGREYYYSVEPKKLDEVQAWLEPLRALWDKKYSQLDALLKKNKTKTKKK